MSVGDLCTWHDIEAEARHCAQPSLSALLVRPVEERIADYDGRFFEPDDFCVIQLGKRLKKSDLCYSRVCKVVERIGAKTYLVRKATGNVVTRPIEALKPYRLDNSVFEGARVSRIFLERASRAIWDIDVPDFDVSYAPGTFDPNDDWKGKTIWLSFPLRERVLEAMQAIGNKSFAELWVIVPDLPCEEWMTDVNAMQGGAWFGSGLGGDFYTDENGTAQNKPIWVDRDGNRTASFPFSWWVGRFTPGDA